jgi:hypothetical protein
MGPQVEGHVFDRAHVFGHVLAHFAVPARERPGIDAVLVNDFQGQSVELRIDPEGTLEGHALLVELVGGPGDEIEPLRLGHGVIEAVHAQPMGLGNKRRQDRAAHPPGRGIGIVILGMRRFQGLELPEQAS